MRLLYLCAVDPPPPQSDGSAVRSFFETLPEYLYPASSDRDSPHKLFFADRVGRSIIMEFYGLFSTSKDRVSEHGMC